MMAERIAKSRPKRCTNHSTNADPSLIVVSGRTPARAAHTALMKSTFRITLDTTWSGRSEKDVHVAFIAVIVFRNWKLGYVSRLCVPFFYIAILRMPPRKRSAPARRADSGKKKVRGIRGRTGRQPAERTSTRSAKGGNSAVEAEECAKRRAQAELWYKHKLKELEAEFEERMECYFNPQPNASQGQEDVAPGARSNSAKQTAARYTSRNGSSIIQRGNSAFDIGYDAVSEDDLTAIEKELESIRREFREVYMKRLRMRLQTNTRSDVEVYEELPQELLKYRDVTSDMSFADLEVLLDRMRVPRSKRQSLRSYVGRAEKPHMMTHATRATWTSWFSLENRLGELLTDVESLKAMIKGKDRNKYHRRILEIEEQARRTKQELHFMRDAVNKLLYGDKNVDLESYTEIDRESLLKVFRDGIRGYNKSVPSPTYDPRERSSSVNANTPRRQ